jgi:hypothetical protein
LRRKKRWKLGSKMTCSWSLERDRSEWIGLRGCGVTGWGENRKTRGRGSNRVGSAVRPPPPLTQQNELQD